MPHSGRPDDTTNSSPPSEWALIAFRALMSESISAYLPSQPGNGPSVVVVHDGRRFWQLVVGVKREQEFFVMRFFGTHVCVRLTPHFRRVVRESPRVVALVLLVLHTCA